MKGNAMETSEFQVPTVTEAGSISGLTQGGGSSPVADGTWHEDPNVPGHVIIDGSPLS